MIWTFLKALIDIIVRRWGFINGTASGRNFRGVLARYLCIFNLVDSYQFTFFVVSAMLVKMSKCMMIFAVQ